MIRETATRPRMLALFPLMAIGAFWWGDDAVIFAVSLLFPSLLALQALADTPDSPAAKARTRDPVTGLTMSADLIERLDDILTDREELGTTTACYVIDIDEFSKLNRRWGRTVADEVLHRVAERIASALRTPDMAARLDGDAFAVALGPVYRLDLESVLAIAARIQKAVSEPISIDGNSIYVTACVGYCLGSRAPERTGASILTGAEIALQEARRGGAGSIRGFSKEMRSRFSKRDKLSDEVGEALENGQIVAWFQPQISTSDGAVTGFEALARWSHPERGMIPPGEFLPAMEAAGRMDRLGEVMLFQSLTALSRWDRAGLSVPRIGVNFSGTEFANPGLVDKISWELDRFDLAHGRLAVEILENVIAVETEDITMQNIRALSELGCRIDLDDFGTGNASITTLRRFPVDRIKVDRSFVTNIDNDEEQREMVIAILMLATRLKLDTLAEGVETVGELTTLTQLGCTSVQGFGLARPMPFDEATQWLRDHETKLASRREEAQQAG